jgi:hypothetical protein
VSDERERSTTVTLGGSWGCFWFVLLCLFLWALIFGVSWNGKHYALGCSCSKGVEVEGP